MKYSLLLLFSLFTIKIFSQSIDTNQHTTIDTRFSDNEWESIQNRWNKKQPSAQIVLQSGKRISGQLIFANSEELIFFPSSEIMINPNQFSDTIHIPVRSINSIVLVKTKKETSLAGSLTGIIVGGGVGVVSGIIIGGGWTILPAIALGSIGIAGGWWIGSKIQKKTNHTIINIDSSFTKSELKSIQKYTVYREDTIFYKNLSQMREHSKVLRSVFPKKHFRLYSGISSGGFLSIKNDIMPVFDTPDLPKMEEYRSSIINFEILNLSWRFKNRYVAGWSFFQYADIYLYNSGNSSSSNSTSYHYSVQAYGTSWYADYVINPIDEYFTKRTEITAGVGLVHLNPHVSYYYHYYDNLKEYYTQGSHDFNIYGLQLRASAAYYLFPGLSLSAGLQGNIYQKATINSEYLQTGSDPNSIIKFPEHSLSFNSLRATVGIGIHF